MAGIFLPTLGLLIALSAFILVRLVMQLPMPIERAIAFPMAIVPNLWGVWNMVYVRVRQNHSWKIGLHGLLLLLIVGPLGYCVGRLTSVLEASAQGLVYFGAIRLDYAHFVIGILIGAGIYYLAWKYVVNFLNELLGIA